MIDITLKGQCPISEHEPARGFSKPPEIGATAYDLNARVAVFEEESSGLLRDVAG